MEQLLPVIIAIIFFGYKQYKKSFEKKDNHRVTPNAESDNQYQAVNQSDKLNDFIGSFMDIEEDELQSVKVTNNIGKVSRDNYSFSHNNDVMPIEKVNNEEKKLVNLDETNDLQDDNYQESMGKDAVIPEFDLRQAVVYDAVLNPPYINK